MFGLQVLPGQCTIISDVKSLSRWRKPLILPSSKEFCHEESIYNSAGVRSTRAAGTRAADQLNESIYSPTDRGKQRQGTSAGTNCCQLLGWRRAQPGESCDASVCQQEVCEAADAADQGSPERTGRDHDNQ